MTANLRTKRLLINLSVTLLALVLGYLAIRPWHLHWGATANEVAQPMPGDLEHVGWTRAITIAATPVEIWPWLVQWGQGRGGWYSYDWLENLFGFDIHTADRILPEFQNLQIGDPICMSRTFCPSHVTVLEPNQWLSWQAQAENGDPVWTFTFGLSPVDDSHTRLIVRESFDNAFMPPVAVSVLEIPDVVMELKSLNTVKDRAEGVSPSIFITLLEIGTWLAALAVSLLTLIAFTNHRDQREALGLHFASVVALLPMTFLFPPLWLRGLLDLGLLAGWIWIKRQPLKIAQPFVAPAGSH